MALIEVAPGVRLHVQDLGDGPPVVLIAGFGLSHEIWDGEVRALTAAGHRAVCVDLRGTGGSDKPLDGYDVPQLAADVGTVLDTLALDNVTLVGWSFGAQISLRLAAASPERLAGLLLVGSNAVRASRSDAFPFGHGPEKLLPALQRGERERRIDARYQTIISGFAEAPDPRLVEFLVRVQLQMPSWAAVACYESYLLTDLTDVPARLTIPVLQIVGDSDPVTPLGGAAWLQDRLTDGRLLTLAGCGHYPMFEATTVFDGALLEFCGASARV